MNLAYYVRFLALTAFCLAALLQRPKWDDSAGRLNATGAGGCCWSLLTLGEASENLTGAAYHAALWASGAA
jgi:hypothetical protein